MKRRDFVTASCLAGLAPLGAAAAAAETDPSGKQFFELRQYHLEAGEKAERFQEFLGQVMVPALNRIGIQPVGLFRPTADDAAPSAYMLLPLKCPEAIVAGTPKLLADETYLKEGADVLAAPKDDPAFLRMESSLLLGFDDCPKLEVPTKSDSRVFQLRIYESHSVAKARKKIEMFNQGGEIAIFRRVGLNPVFFGEALLGSKLPNLTYMVAFDNEAAQEAAWKAFLADPAWDALKKMEVYHDTVSNITNIVLEPLPGSQI